jgi:hypothetical protein
MCTAVARDAGVTPFLFFPVAGLYHIRAPAQVHLPGEQTGKPWRVS